MLLGPGRFEALLSHQGPLVHVDHSHRAPAPTGEDCEWYDLLCKERQRKAEIANNWSFKDFRDRLVDLGRSTLKFGNASVEHVRATNEKGKKYMVIEIYVGPTLWLRCPEHDADAAFGKNIVEAARLDPKDTQTMANIIIAFQRAADDYVFNKKLGRWKNNAKVIFLGPDSIKPKPSEERLGIRSPQFLEKVRNG